MHEKHTNILLLLPSSEAVNSLAELIHAELPNITFFKSTDASDAIAKIQNLAPDAIIFEGPVSKMSEPEFLNWIFQKKNLKEVPVIYFSNNSPDEDQLNLIADGQLHWLAKNAPTPQTLHALKGSLSKRGIPKGAAIQDFRVLKISAGEVLMKQGEKSRTVYILKTGQLKAYDQSKVKPITLGFVEPGEFVGEIAYINGEGRTAHVVAEMDSELIEIPAGIMDYLILKKPSWSRALLKTLSKRIALANKKQSES